MATLELPYEKVYDLLHKCCTSISPDVLYLMKRAAAKETNPEAKTFLETMLKNVELAGQMDKPVCQSPGFPSVWIRWGEAMQPNLTNLMGNITQSVIEATKAGYIRPSIVHPLTRHNPGDSSGRGVPNYELRYEKDLPYCEIIVSAKGCGAADGHAIPNPHSLRRESYVCPRRDRLRAVRRRWSGFRQCDSGRSNRRR